MRAEGSTEAATGYGGVSARSHAPSMDGGGGGGGGVSTRETELPGRAEPARMKTKIFTKTKIFFTFVLFSLGLFTINLDLFQIQSGGSVFRASAPFSELRLRFELRLNELRLQLMVTYHPRGQSRRCDWFIYRSLLFHSCLLFILLFFPCVFLPYRFPF